MTRHTLRTRGSVRKSLANDGQEIHRIARHGVEHSNTRMDLALLVSTLTERVELVTAGDRGSRVHGMGSDR